MNFYNPCPQSVAPKTKLKKPGLKLANLPQNVLQKNMKRWDVPFCINASNVQM